MRKDEIRRAVRDRYGRIAGSANEETSCCAGPSCCSKPSSCCPEPASELSATMGYSARELEGAPDGANMGLGCGNPQAIADLREGETVLDLGSGGGLDCFLSAERVGPAGRVIGVDMTPEMVERARANAARSGLGNVEFRLGEIEHLPVADASVDVIISNCVVNLSPDKAAVFAEARRVLRPGGRLAIADVVAVAEMPAAVREDPALYCGCVTGAVMREEYERLLLDAGFTDVRIEIEDHSRELVAAWSDEVRVEDYAAAARITARKPR